MLRAQRGMRSAPSSAPAKRRQHAQTGPLRAVDERDEALEDLIVDAFGLRLEFRPRHEYAYRVESQVCHAIEVLAGRSRIAFGRPVVDAEREALRVGEHYEGRASLSIRYSTCLRSGLSSVSNGWSKSPSASRIMPSRCMTRCERTLTTAVIATTSRRPSVEKA